MTKEDNHQTSLNSSHPFLVEINGQTFSFDTVYDYDYDKGYRVCKISYKIDNNPDEEFEKCGGMELGIIVKEEILTRKEMLLYFAGHVEDALRGGCEDAKRQLQTVNDLAALDLSLKAGREFNYAGWEIKPFAWNDPEVYPEACDSAGYL